MNPRHSSTRPSPHFVGYYPDLRAGVSSSACLAGERHQLKHSPHDSCGDTMGASEEEDLLERQRNERQNTWCTSGKRSSFFLPNFVGYGCLGDLL